jgi:two-component system OmpR family sensor kinase/two-component system phosphate regulon sensor histidine kinase PhoR
MIKRFSFRKKLFVYFFSVFLIFTLIILIFQFLREKKYRVDQLDNTLENITQVTQNFISHNLIIEKNNLRLLDSLTQIFPQPDVRLTIINSHGSVLYDNSVDNFSLMENHLYRPEIQESLYDNFGTEIRRSATTGQEYYYYSKYFGEYFIRVAVVYNIEVQNFLRAEHIFLLFIAVIFLLTWIVLDFITRKFAESITKLKDFVIKVRKDEDFETDQTFPNDELGVIGHEIIQMYDNLIKTRDSLAQEKGKLFNHLYVLNEGVAFFSKNKTKILTNNHFIQYLNIISNKLSITAEDFFTIPEFDPINEFIDQTISQNKLDLFDTLPSKEISINKSGKYFKIQCILFNDNSFEIIITNITKMEKNRIIKQQMTSNISHELKTPITSIKGYLETILNDPEMEPEQQRRFIERADAQTNRLTDLINDIVILNKIEETGDFFAFTHLNINEIIDEILDDYQSMIIEKSMKIELLLNEDILVHGNRSLVLSVFRNLFENSINYAGKERKITIQIYREDDNFYYFSLSDNGVGIPDEHLTRIFERFYRIDSDRSRKLGGTGLGLAIVKNAVMLHKGEISVKNKVEGGIEFLFSLPKAE